MIKNYEALTNNHSSIELGGPVLPCFVREPLLDEVADVGSQQSFPIPICVIRRLEDVLGMIDQIYLKLSQKEEEQRQKA